MIVVPSGSGAPVADASLPTGMEQGVRWGHTGAALEYSLSFFDGFNHLPDIAVDARVLERVHERVEKREKHLDRISNKKCDRERRHRYPLREVVKQTDHGPSNECDN